MHNMPLTVIVQQIKERQKDGSITNSNQPEEIFLTIWALMIGFIKLNIATPESNRTTLFQVNLTSWRKRVLQLVKEILRPV